RFERVRRVAIERLREVDEVAQVDGFHGHSSGSLPRHESLALWSRAIADHNDRALAVRKRRPCCPSSPTFVIYSIELDPGHRIGPRVHVDRASFFKSGTRGQ